MPITRKVSRREWEAHRFKAIETILVCRHCDEWVLKSRPDRASAECTAENGHVWDEREQTMMIVRDEKGTWVLDFVEVVETDVETAR